MTTAAPLSGTTIVEIGTSVAAPFASWILGSLGARVVKIESAKGMTRQWGRMFPDGRSSFFEALNANKKRLNLRDDEGTPVVEEYCQSNADVVIQNMRPGKVETLGLDGPTLALKDQG